ncbi:MAG: hypothetical protein K8S00_10000 [Bacteroidales bacterium]|nr:hypothetical protein [Bacteroidales bacterium]
MLLTKKDLKIYLQSRKIVISDDFADELIKEYGKQIIDEEGHIFEYSEQDISEQLRKSIQQYLEGGVKKL